MIGSYSYMNYRKFGTFGNNTSQLAFTLSKKTVRFIDRLPDEYSTVRAILLKARNARLIKGYSVGGETGYLHDAIDELSVATGLDNATIIKLSSTDESFAHCKSSFGVPSRRFWGFLRLLVSLIHYVSEHEFAFTPIPLGNPPLWYCECICNKFGSTFWNYNIYDDVSNFN